MSEEDFMVRVNNPQGLYSPGFTVDGRVELKLKKETKMKEIRVVFLGNSEAMWKYWRRDGRLYEWRETFFEQICILLGGDGSETILPAGDHSYPFTFKIPEGVPSSLETPHARIRYTLSGVTIQPNSSKERETRTYITVLDMLDLNTIPGLMSPIKFEDSQQTMYCCNTYGPVTCVIKTDRKGYVPGEAIVFSAEVNNLGNMDIQEVSAQLVMEAHFISNYNVAGLKKSVLYEIHHGVLPAGGSSVWRDEKLHIPPVPPSLLNKVKNLDIKYSVAVYVGQPDLESFYKHFYFPLEIIVGSIPLTEVASQRGISISNGGKYDVQTTPQLTKAVYMESALGKQATRTWRWAYRWAYIHEGMQEFAPIYPYYAWDEGDQPKTFNVRHDFTAFYR